MATRRSASSRVVIEISPASRALLDELRNIRSFEKVMKSARVSASRKLFTAIQREIRAERPIKLRDLKPLITPITKEDAFGFRVDGSPIPVADLPKRQTKRGVKFLSRRSQGWAMIEGAFFARVRSASQSAQGLSGHEGVFKRRPGAGRLPISERFAPGVSVVFVDDARRTSVLETARVEFENTIIRLVNARLPK